MSANIATHHVALLALSVADDIPADQETALIDAITKELTTASRATCLTGTDAAHADPADASGTDDSGQDEPGLLTLTAQLADHLGRCRAQPNGRLTRLVTLASSTQDRALPRILAAVDRILHTATEQQTIAGDDNRALGRDLVGVLARALTPADGILDADVDYDTASAADTLGRTAPAETAQMLADRTLSATFPVIPFPGKKCCPRCQPTSVSHSPWRSRNASNSI